MVFRRFPAKHLIIAVNLFIFVGLIVTYSLALNSGHIEPMWSYISFTGDYPIESCIFSTVFSLCSAVNSVIVYLRYAQISNELTQQNLSDKAKKKMQILNVVSLIFGIFGAFGLSVTGSFQNRVFHLAHVSGVFLCSYFTLVYIILQTYFSFTFMSLVTKDALRFFRLFVVISSSIILSTGPMFLVYYFINYPDMFHLLSSTQPQDTSFCHKVGAVLEWILFFLYHFYIFSLYPDFKKIALEKDQIIFLS